MVWDAFAWMSAAISTLLDTTTRKPQRQTSYGILTRNYMMNEDLVNVMSDLQVAQHESDLARIEICLHTVK